MDGNDDFVSLNFNEEEHEHFEAKFGDRSRAEGAADVKTISFATSLNAQPNNHLMKSSQSFGLKRAANGGLEASVTGQGSKKRRLDGGFVDSARAPPPDYTLINCDATPWMRDMPEFLAQHPVDQLHNEICLFYEFARPRDYERRARNFALDLIRNALTSHERFRGAQLHAFGSFPADLFLPTGDIDAVVLMRDFAPKENDDNPRPKALVRKAGEILHRNNLVIGRSQPILNARIPLFKFQERTTNISIDLSVNNHGGIPAVDTVRSWAQTWPALAPMVFVLKQFLKMRRLNEVAEGGMGSFTLICLVVNFLRHHPAQQNKSTKHSVGLGELLLEFLNHYGKDFNREWTAIKMGESDYGYFPKPAGKDDAPNKFKVIDPHKMTHDISSGTRKGDEVAGAFADAYEILKRAMTSAGHRRRSFLGTIIGGNYGPYLNQREKLRRVSADIIAGRLSVESPYLQPADAPNVRAANLSQAATQYQPQTGFSNGASTGQGRGVHSHRLSYYAQPLQYPGRPAPLLVQHPYIQAPYMQAAYGEPPLSTPEAGRQKRIYHKLQTTTTTTFTLTTGNTTCASTLAALPSQERMINGAGYLVGLRTAAESTFTNTGRFCFDFINALDYRPS